MVKVGNFFRSHTPHLDLDLSSRSEVVDHTRARGAPEFLTWWIATFAATVDRLRDGPLIGELLESHPFDDLQALAALCWRLPTDGVPGSDADWIARSNHSVVVFHRKIQFLANERDRLARERKAVENVWVHILDRIDAKVNRHELYTWFRPMTLVDDAGDVIRVAGPGPQAKAELHTAWIQKHYAAVVREAVEEVRPGARIEFVAEDIQRRQHG